MKVAFLDRDGVINKDVGYVYKIDDFELTDGCIDALKQLQNKGYALIIVTNQSGIGRGYYSESDYQILTQWYLKKLAESGVSITDVFFCPHAPDDNCDCRKPKSGLFQQAKVKYPSIDFSNSLMIGDKLSDINAAKNVDINKLFLFTDDGSLSGSAVVVKGWPTFLKVF